ncbi:hypothetical protein BDY24DRAFT_148641 [Mrakia frigida]|uniref:uncharacterized protein n=1 Tax=Mrakia frigida TaxID=29902 RepID=UPI003FCC13F2
MSPNPPFHQKYVRRSRCSTSLCIVVVGERFSRGEVFWKLGTGSISGSHDKVGFGAGDDCSLRNRKEETKISWTRTRLIFSNESSKLTHINRSLHTDLLLNLLQQLRQQTPLRQLLQHGRDSRRPTRSSSLCEPIPIVPPSSSSSKPSPFPLLPLHIPHCLVLILVFHLLVPARRSSSCSSGFPLRWRRKVGSSFSDVEECVGCVEVEPEGLVGVGSC